MRFRNKYKFYWPNGLCLPGMRSIFISSDGLFFPCEKLYDKQELPIIMNSMNIRRRFCLFAGNVGLIGYAESVGQPSGKRKVLM